MTEIPKRRFALEEKDLSIEADENNKVAEEKENRFLKTKGGVLLTDETMQERSYTTVTGLVLKMGPDCYKDETRYPNGPWCKKNDWIIFGRYAGSRFGIEGGEVRILNEDEIIAVVKDPEDILQYK